MDLWPTIFYNAGFPKPTVVPDVAEKTPPQSFENFQGSDELPRLPTA
jgi:hypothetical protein